MTQPSVVHAAFAIDRTYDAPPARVFAAWATAEAKARWFAGPDGWQAEIRELDFRVGGRERLRGVFPGGRSSDFPRCHSGLYCSGPTGGCALVAIRTSTSKATP